MKANKLTINIHSDITSWSWYDEEKEEGSVANVDELTKLLETNKNASLIDIYINSPGGDVIEGIGIYNILKRNKAYKRVYIDGFACSIASVIAMAGNAIYMPKSSLMMIHNCWTWTRGNANELRKLADDLDKMNALGIQAYMTKFKKSEEELKQLLDNETYLTADECLEYGLCTKVIEDGEETEAMVDEALDREQSVYNAKLERLSAIKESLRHLNAETETSEVVNEAEPVETAVEEESVNEVFDDMKSPIDKVAYTKEEAKEAVSALQQNILQKFFNIHSTN